MKKKELTFADMKRDKEYCDMLRKAEIYAGRLVSGHKKCTL